MCPRRMGMSVVAGGKAAGSLKPTHHSYVNLIKLTQEHKSKGAVLAPPLRHPK